MGNKDSKERGSSFFEESQSQKQEKLFVSSVEEIEFISEILRNPKEHQNKFSQLQYLNYLKISFQDFDFQKNPDLSSLVLDLNKMVFFDNFFKILPNGNLEFIVLDISQLVYLENQQINEKIIKYYSKIKRHFYKNLLEKRFKKLDYSNFHLVPFDIYEQIFKAKNNILSKYNMGALVIENWIFFESLDLESMKFGEYLEIVVKIYNEPKKLYKIVHKLLMILKNKFTNPITILVDLKDTIHRAREFLNIETLLQNQIKGNNQETLKYIDFRIKAQNVKVQRVQFEVNLEDADIILEQQSYFSKYLIENQGISYEIMSLMNVVEFYFENYQSNQRESDIILLKIIDKFLVEVELDEIIFFKVILDSECGKRTRNLILSNIRNRMKNFDEENLYVFPMGEEEQTNQQLVVFPEILGINSFGTLINFLRSLIRSKGQLNGKIRLLYVNLVQQALFAEKIEIYLQELLFQKFDQLENIYIDLSQSIFDNNSNLYCFKMFDTLKMNNKQIRMQDFQFYPLRAHENFKKNLMLHDFYLDLSCINLDFFSKESDFKKIYEIISESTFKSICSLKLGISENFQQEQLLRFYKTLLSQKMPNLSFLEIDLTRFCDKEGIDSSQNSQNLVQNQKNVIWAIKFYEIANQVNQINKNCFLFKPLNCVQRGYVQQILKKRDQKQKNISFYLVYRKLLTQSKKLGHFGFIKFQQLFQQKFMNKESILNQNKLQIKIKNDINKIQALQQVLLYDINFYDEISICFSQINEKIKEHVIEILKINDIGCKKLYIDFSGSYMNRKQLGCLKEEFNDILKQNNQALLLRNGFVFNQKQGNKLSSQKFISELKSNQILIVNDMNFIDVFKFNTGSVFYPYGDTIKLKGAEIGEQILAQNQNQNAQNNQGNEGVFSEKKMHLALFNSQIREEIIV
ncbi:hypothetical protein PPERSA_00712 [Pseudocohnilembus persalinus]|uniref:Uncharacterized protein n=1 Tax=Pseudocohnilembus persalinus TaxID=266149 RepID=A0A0V0QSU4_PSEPJ|nr:hypothetical protein PPERSA_00712 [Pseudocohnilembus persalinus]|eukprot:KRX05411.1 hypothetical protein PPERSA_00712 [Pseudocohnilembus persalinus]